MKERRCYKVLGIELWAEFTEDIKSAMGQLFMSEQRLEEMHWYGKDLAVIIDDGRAYCRRLFFCNAITNIPKGECFSFFSAKQFFDGDVHEYCLEAKTKDASWETTVPYTLRFTDVRVETEFFKAYTQSFFDSPWAHLQSIAEAILEKSSLPEDCYNAAEKEWMPMMVEICKLSFREELPEQFQSSDFSNLKACIQAYGYRALLPLINKLEKEYLNDKKRNRLIKRLVSKLNQLPYEPLWRELYSKTKATQAGYAHKSELLCPANVLNETRTKIQAWMELQGYSGTYPDFVKNGSVRGIHVEESYGMPCFVSGMKKRAEYRIHCTEDVLENCLTIQFLCGTALLRKNERIDDLYSCLFNAQGRRLFHTVYYEVPFEKQDEDFESDDLELMVKIAVKKAELRKLTKEEWKQYDVFSPSAFGLFLLAFIVMGGMFAILMTLAMVVLSVLVTVLFGQAGAIPGMMKEMPWQLLFGMAWIGFGGAMGIITVLTRRK
ncbi:MAG: hypothetical protein IJ333_07405 [Clostridia bacterium]|nr:hypothetical protein [Clostridia bacterium]